MPIPFARGSREAAGDIIRRTGRGVQRPSAGRVRLSTARRITHSLRFPTWRTKPLRGGKDRGIVHKSSASAARPIESDFAPCLYRCAVPCYSRAWLGSAAGSARSFTSRSSGTLPRTRPLPIYSIYIKAKAVPVAASSSELASAGPTRSELRPRSLTALRIQLSSKTHNFGLSYHPRTRKSGSSGDGFLFPSPYRRVSQGGHRLVSQVAPSSWAILCR